MGLEGSARERRRAYTRDEVSRLAANGADLLVIDSIVCDFSSFSHPGGRAVLRRHAGEDVSDMFAGVVPAVKSSTRPMAHDGADAHAHSAAARSMLARLAVGYVESIDSTTTTTTGTAAGPGEDHGPFARVRARRAAVKAGTSGRPAAAAHATSDGGSRPGSRLGSNAGSSDDDELESDSLRMTEEPGCASATDLDLSSGRVSPSLASPPDGDSDGDFGIDATAALVPQVGALGDRYVAWVHRPNADASPLRFFESDWAEAATRTPWWLVPLVWLPIAAYAAFVGCRLAMDGRTGDLGGFGFGDGSFGDGLFGGVWLRWMCLVSAWVAGYWFWGVLEYAFHRFAFHRAPTSSVGITLHFLMHGCHHKAPADACRLVFPPAAAAPVIWFFRRAFRSVIGGYLGAGEAASALFFSGCLTGYVAYDCVHYFLHHWDFDPGTLERAGVGFTDWVTDWVTRRLRAARSTHMAHHYDDSARSFGITSGMFDRAFGTAPRAKAKPA